MVLFCAQLMAVEGEYTLDDLIEIGLKNATTYQMEVLQKKNVHSSLISAYYDFLPSMSVSAGRNYSKIDSKSAGFTLYKGISLNEPTYFNWRQAKYEQQMANLSFQEFRRNTAYEIFSNYVQVLEAEKRVEIQESNLAIQKKISQQVQTLYELKQKSAIELKQSQIALINAQIASQNAVNGLQKVREALFLYLNIPDKGYKFRGAEFDLKEEELVFEYSADIQTSEIYLKKSALSLCQSRLDFLPRLSASYSYNYNYPGRNVTDDLFDFGKYEDSYTIGASLSYSLLNPLEHREAYLRNKRSYRIQQIQLEDKKEQNKLQFIQKKRDWETEKQVYGLTKQKFELASESLMMAEEQFSMGALSLLELDQAKQSYLESEIDLNSQYYQLLLKQEELNLLLSRKILDKWE
jgi:outer membrane protein TolC